MIVVDTTERVLTVDRHRYGCAIGRSGAVQAAAKREGDGCTPLGIWPMRGAVLRPHGGFDPPVSLPWRWCRPSDGWCDDPTSPDYNRAITLPYPYSAERMWRDDEAYDAVLILGHNDAPTVPGMGSAIFLHLRTGDTTEGCVAVDRNAMTAILGYASLATAVGIF